MKQEDKELLLKDLSARLPYGVIVKTPYNNARLEGLTNRKGVIKGLEYVDVITDKQIYPIRYIKPYLRPLSNMTEEEMLEINALPTGIVNDFPHYNDFVWTPNPDMFDWLNAHHFDYRGLVEKGLALEAPEGMYE